MATVEESSVDAALATGLSELEMFLSNEEQIKIFKASSDGKQCCALLHQSLVKHTAGDAGLSNLNLPLR